ncbi:hypothetical protein H0H87_006175 [Tephrocybe sp. NHM501043]|nr:hypothetical protein H0H87_006175 [Tephrocybe sp. NHM501043]
MRSLLPLALLLTIFDATYGIRVPFEVRTDVPPTHLARRAIDIGVKNIGNAQYIGNVTLGGVPARVLLDTGSSDLWVSFPDAQPSSTDLGEAITLSYAVGAATGEQLLDHLGKKSHENAGNAHSTTVEIGDYKVDNQAFRKSFVGFVVFAPHYSSVLVGNTSTFSSNIHTQGYDGLLGLGPNKGSVIYKKLDGHTGDTTLTHIFQQNTNADAYITFLLDRKNGPTQSFTGHLTISEVTPGFENITSMPELDVDTVNKLLGSDQHWQALTDKNTGIIGPDGNPISVSSIVPSAPDGTYVAVFDSGFTFSQVPRDVSDAIYGRVQGAVYDEKNEYWTVPCGQYLNISLGFGGRQYPVHPLDTVDDNFAAKDANGNRVCIGAFQPITSAFSLLGHYDMILGMSFLRNAYTLLNFGTWANGASGEHPFIQLSSVTDSAQARKDFITTRLGGTDTISDPKWALLPADQMQKSPVSAEEKKKKYQELVLSRWPYILVGCLIAVLLIVGFCIWRCCCSAKAKARKAAKKRKSKVGQLFSTEPASTAYLPLEAPHKGGHSPGFSPGGQHGHSNSQFSLPSQHHDHASQHYGGGGAASDYYNSSGGEQKHFDNQYPPSQQYHGAAPHHGYAQ